MLPHFLLAVLTVVPPIGVERFHIQSNPWVNLHQRLQYSALYEPQPPKNLTADETAIWNRSLETYRAFINKRSPLFDAELVKLNADLSKTTGMKLPSSIPAKAAEALRELMPVYQRAQWAEDDAINQFWISVTRPMLQATVKELIAAHEKAYAMPFPKRATVDVSVFGGQFGAYTVGDRERVHVVMSPLDPAYQGFAALEMLMHETSHGIVDAAAGAIGDDLTRIAKELDRRAPRDLWHALLFFTSGHIAREALARRGITDYQPIIDRGMYERGYRGMQEPLETHWRAYLAGTKSRDEAIRDILLAVTKPRPR